MPISQIASRSAHLEASPIREILSLAAKPGVISFAGGLPARDSFPDISSALTNTNDLQYGPSEGEEYLRKLIADDLQQLGIHIRSKHVLILSGSQQGIDLMSKLFVESGTPVAVESPTYLAALQVFKLFGASLISYEIHDLHRIFSEQRPNLLYTNPTFQNPSSRVYSATEREELARYCEVAGAVLFEDDPYRDLVYSACERTPICSYMSDGSWVYQSTFSKTIAPGLRLGYLACSENLFPYLVKLKQAADLHSCRVSQRIVYQLLTDDDSQARLDLLRQTYKKKRDKFHHCLIRYFSDIADWDLPEGGLFFWLRLKSTIKVNTRELSSLAIDQNVLFMPGEPFFADGRDKSNCFRLNFSNAEDSEIEAGLSILASIFRDHTKQLNS